MSAKDSAQKVHLAFRDAGIKLALAESCTGGYIAHLLTSIPGASDFFASSIVAYSEEAKINLLGLDKGIIEEHGTISPQCALEMAGGAARTANAEAALSVTGILGPKPVENKEVGLVFAAVLLPGRTMAREFHFKGERDEIKYLAAEAALNMLHEEITTWT